MKFTTKQICATAVFAALTFIITRLLQIPIPLGYFNVGNCIILTCCAILPAPCGILAGCIGSALADLTSYPVYTVPTIIIKGLMALVFYVLCRKPNHRTLKWRMFAAIIATLIPLVGYTITGCILYGSIGTGLAQVPGLLIEYAVNLILLGILLSQVLRHKLDRQFYSS